MSLRICSAPGEPPGSRVARTLMPRAPSDAANRLIWVDLPVPSPPSRVMKRPAIEALFLPETRHGVPRLAEDADFGDRLRRIDRHRQSGKLRRRDHQHANLLADRDRRLQARIRLYGDLHS